MICSSENTYNIGYCAVLGSGVGETIIIKIGDNEWCVVDCHKIKIDDKLCVSPLYFLEKIGVNITTDIKFIFATHWDDDHISGMSELLEKAKNAIFATTAVVTDKKFYGYLRGHYDNPKNTPHKSGVNEFFECQRIIIDRQQKIKKLKQNELIYQNDCVDIYALSPHDDVVDNIFDFLMKDNPNILNKPIKVCVPPKPNDTSVVLLIKFKKLDSQILLGADLEELDKKSWSKLIQDNVIDNIQAGIFKIPHHGSKNGYCEQVYDTLLTKNPILIIAPFTRSGLPQEEELILLKQHSEHIYVTANHQEKKIKIEDKSIQRALHDKNARQYYSTLKYVEALPSENNWIVKESI